jgi:2-dehydro-3-deoxygluconokinase
MSLSRAADHFDVVTVGETMASFVPDGSADRYRAVPAGAESNVAIGVAQLGLRSCWFSRLGDDDLGRLVHDRVGHHGVDVRIEWDAERATGVMIKDFSSGSTRVQYHRSASAASGLDERHRALLPQRLWTHLSGITPALSAGAHRLVASLLRRGVDGGRRSFDFNYRPVLWPGPVAAAEVLVPLAREADLVFIGDDEATSLFGTCSEDELRRSLISRPDQELVLKRGGGQATLITSAGSWSRPARRVDVVDVTGAGDAFAAGYLAGTCRGWDAARRLELGHFLAARAISGLSDFGPALEIDEAAVALGTSHQLNSDDRMDAP